MANNDVIIVMEEEEHAKAVRYLKIANFIM